MPQILPMNWNIPFISMTLLILIIITTLMFFITKVNNKSSHKIYKIQSMKFLW